MMRTSSFDKKGNVLTKRGRFGEGLRNFAKLWNIVIAMDTSIMGNYGNYFMKLNIFHKNIVII